MTETIPSSNSIIAGPSKSSYISPGIDSSSSLLSHLSKDLAINEICITVVGDEERIPTSDEEPAVMALFMLIYLSKDEINHARFYSIRKMYLTWMVKGTYPSLIAMFWLLHYFNVDFRRLYKGFANKKNMSSYHFQNYNFAPSFGLITEILQNFSLKLFKHRLWSQSGRLFLDMTIITTPFSLELFETSRRYNQSLVRDQVIQNLNWGRLASDKQVTSTWSLERVWTVSVWLAISLRVLMPYAVNTSHTYRESSRVVFFVNLSSKLWDYFVRPELCVHRMYYQAVGITYIKDRSFHHNFMLELQLGS